MSTIRATVHSPDSLSQVCLDGMPLHFDGDFRVGPFGSDAGLALTRTRKVWCVWYGMVWYSIIKHVDARDDIKAEGKLPTLCALESHCWCTAPDQRARMFRADLLGRIRYSMRTTVREA
jgi:hypothetical protein